MKKPRSVVVASSAAASAAFDISSDTIAAIYMPVLDGTTTGVRLLASTTSGGTYLPVYDSGGNLCELTVVTSATAQWVFLEAEWTYGLQFVKLECMAAAATDAQSAARTFTVITRMITGG